MARVSTLSHLEAPPGLDRVDPVVDVVLPVHNEAHVLALSTTRLHRHLARGLPFAWRISIVDNASTDRTFEVAGELSRSLAGVRAVHLDGKGRGLALRDAWSTSPAAVLAYMDVDLSTGLDAVLPLVAPIVAGHSDLVVGSRRGRGARVRRSLKREAISRAYNLLLGLAGLTGVADAQCGFKAISASAAARLLPQVVDDGWFFDTELLARARGAGLRVLELPVDWIEDPDSRVDLAHTAGRRPVRHRPPAGRAGPPRRRGADVTDRPRPCGSPRP